ncbi:MAG: DUF1844 domain-containing protein [Candidatus Ratteibacteria bacterium]
MEQNPFFNLLTLLHAMCWQALGKIPNPATGKADPNLDFAKQVIDILESLEEKSRGNLSEEEKRYFDSLLADLRMNYVDEVSKKKEAADTSSSKNNDKPSQEGSKTSA